MTESLKHYEQKKHMIYVVDKYRNKYHVCLSHNDADDRNSKKISYNILTLYHGFFFLDTVDNGEDFSWVIRLVVLDTKTLFK